MYDLGGEALLYANDSIQMYLWKNKVIPGYNIGKKTIKALFYNR